MQNLLLDKGSAAFALGISTVTLDRLRKIGSLPYRQIGGRVMFTSQDIDSYIQNSAVGGLETRSKEGTGGDTQ
jgi:hypothetical protein